MMDCGARGVHAGSGTGDGLVPGEGDECCGQICVTSHLKIDHQTKVGSARIEVVRFVGCGGLATFLAPGRDTYRRTGPCGQPLFSPAKKRANILK